ncbi:hypothetical protein MMC26_003245 [Xylographa opegraphella]|nr:hypothetical protein [Xylographa opegraphella]
MNIIVASSDAPAVSSIIDLPIQNLVLVPPVQEPICLTLEDANMDYDAGLKLGDNIFKYARDQAADQGLRHRVHIRSEGTTSAPPSQIHFGIDLLESAGGGAIYRDFPSEAGGAPTATPDAGISPAVAPPTTGAAGAAATGLDTGAATGTGTEAGVEAATGTGVVVDVEVGTGTDTGAAGGVLAAAALVVIEVVVVEVVIAEVEVDIGWIGEEAATTDAIDVVEKADAGATGVGTGTKIAAGVLEVEVVVVAGGRSPGATQIVVTTSTVSTTSSVTVNQIMSRLTIGAAVVQAINRAKAAMLKDFMLGGKE